MPDPSVEVVGIRDPSSQTWLSVYVDGVAVEGRSVVIDAGHGWEWDDWREFRDATLAEASSPACRAELIDAFDDPPGGEYVLGRAAARTGSTGSIPRIDSPPAIGSPDRGRSRSPCPPPPISTPSR
ncbi:hypothetical protein [Nocardia asiatica]|uniref:hypothetical protein n=1 Tax=Nocardia asiatica TaxID=209252 RepID=UPI0002EE3720|nr:hypothetical protein [Nocardia asiatica]